MRYTVSMTGDFRPEEGQSYAEKRYKLKRLFEADMAFIVFGGSMVILVYSGKDSVKQKDFGDWIRKQREDFKKIYDYKDFQIMVCNIVWLEV